jgi:hypothetical protein
VSTVTLPTGLFWLIVGGAAFVAALLTATAAERMTRVRRETSHALYHRAGCPDHHTGD